MSRAAPWLVLASASPRRRALLARLGLEFSVDVPDVDETPAPGEKPPAHAMRIAVAKARAVGTRRPDAAVLAADTVVALGTRIFGKPASRPEAAAMLAELAGRTHTVFTATVLRCGGREAHHLETASVKLVSGPPELYDWYVGTGEVDDKAGAYAVQGKGAVLVERIEGNVQAVMGLPLAALPRLFETMDLRLAVSGDRLTLSRKASPRG